MCRDELIASMAWRRRLSDHSCLAPSHHLYQDKKTKCKWIHEDGAFGDVFIKHVLASAIKKGGPLEEIKIVII